MEASRKHRESERPGEASTSQLKSSLPPPLTFGRYLLHAPIARGGMATIHIARLVGAEGFSRLVAAKRLHPQYTQDPEFVAMFHDEARVASRIHHPNVVPVLDVVLQAGEVILVQEYVHGAPLDKLFHASLDEPEAVIPVGVVSAIMCGMLAGLEAAHETKDEVGEPLALVHRDVSPQNVMISLEGVPRLLDFGIAKARSSAHVTREGFFKGKVAYMAPEQLRAEHLDRTADLYACGVILWELLAHRRIHAGRGEAEMFHAILSGAIPSLTSVLEDGQRAMMDDARWDAIRRFEPVVARALAMRPTQRYATARDMMDAVAAACPPAPASEVAAWVRARGAEYLAKREKAIAASEESWRSCSRITAAAMQGDGVPESIARLAAAQAVLAADPSILDRVPSSVASRLGASYVTPFAPPPMSTAPPPTFAARHLPWLVAGSLLLLCGVLLGLISSRAPAPQTPPPETAAAIAPPAERATPAASDPAPATVTTITPNDPTLPSAVAPPRPAPRATAPTPLPNHALVASHPAARAYSPPAHAASPSPPAHASASAPSPAPAPSPPPQPSAKVDCDPPFYFEGTKKVFKPACL